MSRMHESQYEQVRRLTNRHGQDAVEAQLREADGAIERHVEPSAGVDGPQMVNVAIDGGWVRSRDNPNCQDNGPVRPNYAVVAEGNNHIFK